LSILLQGLFSQNVADIIAQMKKYKVDKGANTIAIPFCGVCAIDEFLSIVVKGEEDFIFHGSFYFSDFSTE
jgi:hypothetical protein